MCVCACRGRGRGEINYLSSINIKENCKTRAGVMMLLLQTHLIIAPGKNTVVLNIGTTAMAVPSQRMDGHLLTVGGT